MTRQQRLSLSFVALIVCFSFGLIQSNNAFTQEPRQSSIGESGGFQEVVTVPEMQQPGLAGFFLNFLGSNTDWEISHIKVLTSTDKIELDYSGALPKFRRYSFRVDRQELPLGTIFRSVTGSVDVIEGVTHRLSMPGELPGVPVLRGFQIFHGSQHDLERIEVRLFRDQFDQQELEIIFHDKSPSNDDFSYRVDFAVVPAELVSARGSLQPSPVTGTQRAYITRYDAKILDAEQPVLQGFDLKFENGDHEMDQIGIRLQPGLAEVWYNDKNKDDPFSWSVQFVDLRSFNIAEIVPVLD